jgi:hypothetical protein
MLQLLDALVLQLWLGSAHINLTREPARQVNMVQLAATGL